MSSGARVYVARYNSTDQRDPDHWAIYIDEPSGEESIHQIVDKFENGGYRVASTRYDTRPERSTLFKEKVLVGNLSRSAVSHARDLIQTQPVNNRESTWNCQSWVMEALENLEAKSYIRLRSEDMHYLRGKRQRWQ